jgi:hypothetical protein
MFWKTSQTFEYIDFINKFCFKTPPLDNTLPYLFYTNAKTTTHKNNVFHTTLGQIFKFLTQEIHSHTCLSHCKLATISNNKKWSSSWNSV